MGTFIKDKYIVEFCGIPGAGKSYISHKLAQCIKSEKRYIKIDERAYKIGFMPKILKIIIKGYYTIVLTFILPKKMAKLFKITNKLFKNKIDFFKQYINTCFVLYIILSKSKKYDLCIMDQGIYQLASSLSLETNNISIYKSILSVLKEIVNKKIICINLDTDNKISFTRMKSRKKGFSRLERLEFEEYTRYVKFIKKCFKEDQEIYTVDNKKEEFVLNEIKKIIKDNKYGKVSIDHNPNI